MNISDQFRLDMLSAGVSLSMLNSKPFADAVCRLVEAIRTQERNRHTTATPTPKRSH